MNGKFIKFGRYKFSGKILKDNIRQTVRTPLPYMGLRSQTEDPSRHYGGMYLIVVCPIFIIIAT